MFTDKVQSHLNIRYRKMVSHAQSSEFEDLERSTGDHDVSKKCDEINGVMIVHDIGPSNDTDSLTEPLLKGSDSGDVTPDPKSQLQSEETSLTILLQVSIPFLIAGLGMVCAGMVLDIVQHWEIYLHISEIFILVPALLGLKGNLEMTLASRLSTQANLGKMDTRKEMWSLIIGNLALVQCQATVVGFLASVAAVVMGWIPDGKFDIQHSLLLCASSLITANLASLVLGSIMVLVVVVSRKFKINPDNVATPIAASLGDLITLVLLSYTSSFLYKALEDKQLWVSPLMMVIFISLMPLWIVFAKRNKYTSEVLDTGWTPVIIAMLISSTGGLILDYTLSSKKFQGIAVYQPVINGVGGNLVAVQASRLSTALHKYTVLGTLPENRHRICVNPLSVFCGKNIHSKTARVLLLMVIPGQSIFMCTISVLRAGHISISVKFAALYLSAALLQVLILLFNANIIVHIMWKQKIDPDNSAIPYLTALGDLIGTALLAVAFWVYTV